MKKYLSGLLFIWVVLIGLSVTIIYLNQNHGYFMFSSPSYDSTYVSLRFDDGLKSQKQAFELLRKYNLTGSVYIISDNLEGLSGWEEDYYLNLSEVKSISEFMEIGSHSKSHADLIRVAQYESEIVLSKKNLEGYGFNISTFVYPGGNYNPRVLSLVKRNYDCASTQDVGTNGIPIRPHLLKDFTLRSYNDISTAKRVIKDGKWNILTFHDIGPIEVEKMPTMFRKVAESNSFSLEEFENLLEYLKQNNIQVVTIKDGCDLFK